MFNFPARRQRTVKCKMALTSQQCSGHAGQNDQEFCKWPPRSPDLTVCDFFLWGYVKNRVYVPPPPTTVDQLQERITAAVKSVTPDMLQRVWAELDYRIDVCRVTRVGAHWVCVIPHETVSLCNCCHRFCKNIPLRFGFITTWNQGVFLCSPCILFSSWQLAFFGYLDWGFSVFFLSCKANARV